MQSRRSKIRWSKSYAPLGLRVGKRRHSGSESCSGPGVFKFVSVGVGGMRGTAQASVGSPGNPDPVISSHAKVELLTVVMFVTSTGSSDRNSNCSAASLDGNPKS